MNRKYRFAVIILFKILSIIFFLSAIGSFITTIIYNVINDADDIFFRIFANFTVTLFYRMAMALFFYVFAMFVTEWLKIDEKE
jgi:hypothetical protein